MESPVGALSRYPSQGLQEGLGTLLYCCSARMHAKQQQETYPRPKGAGKRPSLFTGVNSNTWRLSWGAISKPTPARHRSPWATPGVVEGPAPLKELGSRAQAMRGDLLSGATIPKGHLYSRSGPKREAMKNYIDSCLKAGLIRPSSSPAGTSFFFVAKTDGIDNNPLNEITVKNSKEMRNDVKEYVAVCTTCAPNKTSQPKMGLLETLLVPSHPWSYISLNFVTDLPASRGNTTVLTAVDLPPMSCLQKSCVLE
ncbi:hypothetical protein L3Q82_004259 [Scortum barcoo]|uniref:Uncharacterized protein n=1 Tax=Scortum barcoo TaxID=214431 RepID=A0ACB8VJ75_9TELE|nr:hypothetical protein L3Q82_004259 [Scortum barcoo]